MDLQRTLQSVGIECFVRYYDLLADDRHSNAEIAERIQSDFNYTSNSCRSRTSHGRRIIREGYGRMALQKAVGANIDERYRQIARDLLQRS